MIKLSGLIITYNEEKNIERCLDSLAKVADEIIVIDSFSNDRTEEICRSKGVIFIQNKFEGYIEQRNYAVSNAKYKHVLALDADEVLSPELTQSIMHVKTNWQNDAYQFNRLPNYCGKWIRHCGWYPDKKVRLLDSTKGKFGGTNPHDKFIPNINTTIGFLKGDLFHFSYNSIKAHIYQVNYFTDTTSKQAYLKNKTSNLFLIVFSPLIKFIKSYFIQMGMLDGYYGLVISIISAHATFLKYVKLKELWKNS